MNRAELGDLRGRMGQPEEFGSLVCEIVRNAMLNGATLRLDAAARLQPK
jgi:hypothetical protein